LVGIIPALEMMTVELDGREPIRLGYWSLVLWCLAGTSGPAFSELSTDYQSLSLGSFTRFEL
jgi:hypothetical protein